MAPLNLLPEDFVSCQQTFLQGNCAMSIALLLNQSCEMPKQWCHQKKRLPTREAKRRQHLRCQIVMAANNIYSEHLCFQCLLFRNRCFEKLTRLLPRRSLFRHCVTLTLLATPLVFIPPFILFIFSFFFCSLLQHWWGVFKALVTEQR